MSDPREPLAPREPLHQPPNPADLRRAPPANPECARVRGLLRDFADQDLTAVLAREVEEHAHRCRVCAVELARAEHEVMRVRRAFASLLFAATPTPSLPPNFAASVVERLVLDETSRDAAGRVAAAVAKADDRNGSHASGDESREFTVSSGKHVGRLRPMVLLACALLLVSCLGVGLELLGSFGADPQREARLVLIDADQTFDVSGKLAAGAGLGEQESLWVLPGGGARLYWHDPSMKAQPAATLQVHGRGQVRLESGAPLLVSGRADVVTHRPVSIPMGDGSRLDLGVGEYSILADGKPTGFDESMVLGTDGLPDDLWVSVQVQSGEPAVIVRAAVGSTFVASGQVGVYLGDGPAAISSIAGPRSGGIASGGASRRQDANDTAPAASLVGYALDRSGAPAFGAGVLMSFGVGTQNSDGYGTAGYDGRFHFPTQLPVATAFTVMLATPPILRNELGMLAPDAVAVVRNGSQAHIANPLVFELASPVIGTVRDDAGVPRDGVAVVPAIVDEWLGCVFPLLASRALTVAGGQFRIDRLPARLPPHQHLVLLVLSEDFTPMSVPIPVRGSVAADLPLPSIQLRDLRLVQLYQLPPNAIIEVLEEWAGLPAGSAYWRRRAVTDNLGRVASLAVGALGGFGEKLWFRVLGSTQVKELKLDSSNPPRYKPALGLMQPVTTVFRSTLCITGTDAEVTNSWRHQLMVPATAEVAPGTGAVQVIDGLGRSIEGVHLFAIDNTGPRGAVNAQFLGLTSHQGMVALPEVLSADGVLALAADGSSAWAVQSLTSSSVIGITLAPSGRVHLAPSLRPANGGLVTMHFQRTDVTLPGMSPWAVRFACEATDWEVRDVAPGEYRVLVNGTAHNAVVPSGGFVTVQ